MRCRPRLHLLLLLLLSMQLVLLARLLPLPTLLLRWLACLRA
jgi:hypothetical protein